MINEKIKYSKENCRVPQKDKAKRNCRNQSNQKHKKETVRSDYSRRLS